MKNYRSISCTTHARIRDAHDVGDAFAQELGRYRHIPYFRHARISAGTAVSQNHYAILIYVETRIIHTGVKILNRLENNCPSAVAEQVSTCRRGLNHRTVRGNIAMQYGNTRMWFKRLGKRMDHFPIPALCSRDVLPN